MKILLIGEYSNVHATLAKGLRWHGHEATVLSNGDFWKDYPRDIDLSRRTGKIGGLAYYTHLCTILPRLRGYDVVQLINPMFLELKAQRIAPIYRHLRKHNGKMILGGFGMDWYWVHTCITDKPLRYSDFNIGDQLRTNNDALCERNDWIGTPKERLNQMIADDCDGIVTGLYEYWVCYHPFFPKKTSYIPYPIEMPKDKSFRPWNTKEKVRIFIGINKARSEYKGTDIMLAAAKQVLEKYPDQMELKIAESVPYAQYQEMMDGSDAILDQLYSYTPSMNPLQAMAKGIICIGGGEPENYEILGEKNLRPIINVEPTYESVCYAIEQLILHPEQINQLKADSIEYISRHHEYSKVAQKYVEFYDRV